MTPFLLINRHVKRVTLPDSILWVDHQKRYQLQFIYFKVTYSLNYSLRKKCPYSELFWPVFSRICTKYAEVRSIYAYLVRMRELWTRISLNTDTFHSVIDIFKIAWICWTRFWYSDPRFNRNIFTSLARTLKLERNNIIKRTIYRLEYVFRRIHVTKLMKLLANFKYQWVYPQCKLQFHIMLVNL